jgi:hypothetical protein
VTNTASNPVAAVRNLAAKAFRRAGAVPKAAIRAARRTERAREHAARVRAEWSVERELAGIARGREPILLGPWLSEVGFEVLYWIPFLRWFEDRYRIDRDRVIAVSRGGVADWYEPVAARYVEIFHHLDPDTFARRNADRRTSSEGGGQKQTAAGSLDDDILVAAKRQFGIASATVCHPSAMYRLFGQFWLGNRALDLVMSHTRHARYTLSPPADLELPDRYVAVKFYTGTALPPTEANTRALRGIVAAVASRMPVVMLDAGMKTDEHEDYLFRDIPNVISLQRHVSAATNLGVQTAVIAGAERFIGTCGSLAWLAPMLGVDTIAVYAEERLLLSHIFFATHVYRQTGSARFDPLDLSAASHVDLAAAAEAVVECRSRV